MQLKTIADISATATPAVSNLPDVNGTYTILNTDTANSAYVLHDPNTIPASDVTSFAGLAAALAADGGVEVKAGQAIVVRGVPWFHVVCATGLTATLQVVAGELTGVTNVTANLGDVGLRNVAETEINPATEDKQDDIIASLGGGIEAGAAIIAVTSTSGTLAALLTAAGAALPAGTTGVYLQNIGGVTVTQVFSGTATAGSGKLIAANDSISIPTTKTLADAWTLVTAAANCNVLVSWKTARS